MPDRLPPPGPSFPRDRDVSARGRPPPARTAPPTAAPDVWWLTLVWIADEAGVVAFRDLAPAAGPPPDPPLARLGPAGARAVSGRILGDGGRLQLRLGTVVPPDDPTRPWAVPAAVRAAFRFEPARAAT